MPRRRQLTLISIDRGQRIVAARTAGLTWAEIAAQVGISSTRCHELYRRTLADIPSETVAEHRERLTRLADRALVSLVAMGEDPSVTPRSRAEAWSVAARWADRLARLHGCDQQRDVPLVIDAPDVEVLHDRIAERVLQLRSEAGA